MLQKKILIHCTLLFIFLMSSGSVSHTSKLDTTYQDSVDLSNNIVLQHQQLLLSQSKHHEEYLETLTGRVFLIGGIIVTVLMSFFGWLFSRSLKLAREEAQRGMTVIQEQTNREMRVELQKMIDDYKNEIDTSILELDELKKSFNKKTKSFTASIRALRQSLSAYYDVKEFTNTLKFLDSKGDRAEFSRFEKIKAYKRISEFSDYFNFDGVISNLTTKGGEGEIFRLSNGDNLIVLTPDQGEVKANSLYEKHINFNVAKSFKNAHEFMGISVIRPTDVFELEIQFHKDRPYQNFKLTETELGADEWAELTSDDPYVSIGQETTSLKVTIKRILKPMRYKLEWDW